MLARISQTGSVDLYMDQFTKLSRRSPGFSSQALLSFFIEGLKPHIRANVKAHRPMTLYAACELAKLFENSPAAHRAQLEIVAPRAQYIPAPQHRIQAPTAP